MKKLLLLPLLTAMLLGGTHLTADDDRYENRNDKRVYPAEAVGQTSENRPHKNYVKECGSCHMAYQPEFLPKGSWKKMMRGLEDHFGVDATLAEEDEKMLSAYLQNNAADSKRVGKHYRKMAASAGTDGNLIRISDTRYFKKEHRRIPKKLIDQNEVKSIANCNACHQKAASGNYRERGIFIPNYGPWED